MNITPATKILPPMIRKIIPRPLETNKNKNPNTNASPPPISKPIPREKKSAFSLCFLFDSLAFGDSFFYS